MTTVVRQEDDFLGCAGPIIGDVKKVAIPIEQPHAAFFLGNVLADHDHAICLLTSRGLVVELGHVFVLQTQHFIATLDNDFLFDLIRFLPRPCFGDVTRRPVHFRPGVGRQLLRQGAQVWHAIVAENEANAWVGVPAVEVLGLGEVGVAAQKDAPKTAAKTGGDGAIESIGGAFMAGAIAGTIDDAEDFAGVGQANDQGMITPDAVVGDVHAFFAFGVGAHQGAVGIDAGLVEKVAGLLLPECHASVIEDVLEEVDFVGVETSAKIAGGGGIGKALGTEGVEKGGIVAAQLDVLEARAVAEGVVGEVEDVIGIGIGQVQFEQLQASVDSVDQADVLGKFVKQRDAAESGAIDALVEFKVEVATATKDGLGGVGELGFVEASLHDLFSCVEFLAKDAVAFASGDFALEAFLPLASLGLLV